MVGGTRAGSCMGVDVLPARDEVSLGIFARMRRMMRRRETA